MFMFASDCAFIASDPNPGTLNQLTIIPVCSGITLSCVWGSLWLGWVLDTLKLSKDNLKPKNDFHLTFLSLDVY